MADIEALPPSVVTEAIVAQLDADQFEVYVPEWFGDIAKGKANDVGAFLAGSAAWVRSQSPPA
jgi:hypothetical protein